MSGNSNYIQALDAINKQEFQKALKLLNKAILKEANSAEYYSERGVVLFHLKRGKEALKDMEKAVNLEPDNSYRYSARAFIKDSVGDTEGAVKDYEKAVDLDPEDAIAYNNLGMLQEKMGYEKKAKKNFDTADELADSHGWNDIFQKDQAGNTVVKGKAPIIKENITPPSRKSIILDVFRSKKVLKEFLQFMKKGFKS